MRWPRSLCLLIVMFVACTSAACAGRVPHRPFEGNADLDCTIVTQRPNDPCPTRTPEISNDPPYRLHFVELDDQGWLYPGRGPADTEGAETADAHIERAITDVSGRLKRGEHVMLFVFVHGWKHGARYDDRDVQRFRDILSEAAAGVKLGAALGQPKRTVVGIYVGWRGGGTFSAKNPAVFFTFWTRKNAALHVSGGAVRELFARLKGLRERWNTPSRDASPADRQRALHHPRLRTVVVGHSFGGWIAFAALSPSVLELLAHAVDREPTDEDTAWLSARVRSTADMIVLLNPAFEATRYQPLHNMAQRAALSRFEAPVLVIITSTADWATKILFPLGRRVNTLFQHEFASPDEKTASVKVPGFVPSYRTHELTLLEHPTACRDWSPAPTRRRETIEERRKRTDDNVALEIARHRAWLEDLGQSAGKQAWSWEYCGGSELRLSEKAKPDRPVWNIVTDKSVISAHSDIVQEPLNAFLRQLYMTLSR